jgi:hypothetical protein
MAQKGDLYLIYNSGEHATTLSPFSRTYQITDTEPIIREARTASGRLVRDVGVTKKTFTVSWDALDGDKFDELLLIYTSQLNELLKVKLYDYTGASAVVYYVRLMPLDRTRLLLMGNIWKNVTLVMDEI